ncbi:MAG: lysophospholipid acyltransferase family protein, partial [Gammaproteobacteria bacterium]
MRITLRVWTRGARLVVHVLFGLLLAAVVNLDFSGRLRPEPLTQRWMLRLLRILRLRFAVRGHPAPGTRLLVANHVSWLDIALIAAAEPVRFVAKSEIRDWPLAGWLANAAGTFYIRRGKGGSRPLIERLVVHLAAGGGSVVLFPEGTTTDGRDVGGFHARLFAAPVDTGVTVQPLALRYRPAADGREIAPFIGDDDLLSHILRLLREPELHAELVYCAPIGSCGQDRSALAARSRAAVREALGLPPAPPTRQPRASPAAVAA